MPSLRCGQGGSAARAAALTACPHRPAQQPPLHPSRLLLSPLQQPRRQQHQRPVRSIQSPQQ